MFRKFMSVTIPLFATLLLILSGWGFNDWRGYFSHPARVALVAFAVAGAAMALVLGLDLEPLRRGRLPTGTQSLELLALTLSSIGLIWFLPFADRRHMFILGTSQVIRYGGLLIFGAGIVIRLAALASLGEQFSGYVTLQENHQLIESGIYSVVRHPLYLSLLLAGPGFALVFASRLVWPILAVTVTFIAVRIRQEERLLTTEFGRSYDEYRSRTWTLLPPIL